MSAFRVLRRFRDLLDVDWSTFADEDVAQYDAGTGKLVGVPMTGGGGPVAAEDVSVDSTTLVGTGTDVQAVLEELDNGIADHLADTADAHDASAISVVDAGGYFTGTDVETVTQELGASVGSIPYVGASPPSDPDDGDLWWDTDDNTDSPLDDHIADPTGAHAATAVSFTPAGSVAATDAQTAIAEVATDAAAAVAALSAVYQPLDDDLTAIAAVASQTAFGRALLAVVDAAALRAAAGQKIVRRSANTAARNSGNTGSTLTDDDATGGTLAFAIAANEVWFFQAWLYLTAANATMDSKFGWSVPAGATMLWGLPGAGNTAGSKGFGAWSSTDPGAINTESGSQLVNSAALTYGVSLAGKVVNGATPGTVTLQWAQNTANGSDLLLLADSILLLWRVA